jgi:hypothetical protein
LLEGHTDILPTDLQSRFLGWRHIIIARFPVVPRHGDELDNIGAQANVPA